MRILLHSAWLFAVVLCLLHQVAQYGFQLSIPFADAYLDPFLSIPIALGALLIERNYLFGRGWLTALETVVIVSTLVVIFEVFFPRWQPRFIGDPYDLLAYACGTVYFWWLINPDSGEKSSLGT